jgi:hypothetical protein
MLFPKRNDQCLNQNFGASIRSLAYKLQIVIYLTRLVVKI